LFVPIFSIQRRAAFYRQTAEHCCGSDRIGLGVAGDVGVLREDKRSTEIEEGLVVALTRGRKHCIAI